VNSKPRAGDLVKFHTIHKYLIMAHSPQHYREMGKLVAAIRDLPFKQVLMNYLELLMTACKRAATPSKNHNVLLHILGYFKNELDHFEKQELIRLIDQYKDGMIPLIVPVTLINHYVNKYNKAYLGDQVYLNPHPMELKLRNHA
ncbi:MAG TPA: YbgA family protein, partial [Candidatus Cloacimonadota bacterium]|nr:YbgA family protein [Candidatus Cloacimonadota bacterium]